MVEDILTVLRGCPGGYPVREFLGYYHQLQKVPTEFLTMLSCHIVIDETQDLKLLKFYRHLIVGDGATSPKIIESYIRGPLN